MTLRVAKSTEQPRCRRNPFKKEPYGWTWKYNYHSYGMVFAMLPMVGMPREKSRVNSNVEAIRMEKSKRSLDMRPMFENDSRSE